MSQFSQHVPEVIYYGYMKSLSLSRPHAIFMVGLPGSGKSFFAEQFAHTFNAPYINSRAIAHFTKTASDAELVAEALAGELAKTKQTFIYEATMDMRAKRTEFAQWARSKGYQPLLIWVQVDQRTAMNRSLKMYDMTKQEYHDLTTAFSPPHQDESPIVLSGKHTYATQAKAVLARMARFNNRDAPTLAPPVERTPKPHQTRKSITIG